MATVRYASHEVVLEPDQWQVRVGPNIVTPEPKVFELLCYLMRHPGRVVGKAELLDALWSGEVVGESVLTRCISCARKVLSDDSKIPRFIRTLHGRGYEFIAPVRELVATSQESSVEANQPAARASASAPPQLGERGFVGRKAETSLLREALRALGAEHSDFMLISGEAGIGKSRLLDEVTRTVPPGVEIHRGYCSPVEGAPPFLVWQQCFRSIIRQRTMKAVLRAFGDDASEARRLLLGTDRRHVEDTPGWDSPSQRFRTFDAIAQGLAELARQRALVLVLDDLQFADLGSLLLFEFLIQQRVVRLLMVGAMRDAERAADEARAQTLSNIRAACRSEVGLSGLSQDEVRQFVELRLEQDHAALAESLHARTGGNPFFLTVLTLSQESTRASESSLPTAIRQAVSHRLAILDGDCVALLRVASVFGREFEVSALSRAANLPVEACLRLVGAAAVARVVTTTHGSEYRFVHDLIREVLYAEMGVDERTRAHLAVGRALETVQEYQHPRNASILAHHFTQGAHLGGATRALDLSIRAGAYALRNFAYEEAIEQFTRASSLLALGTEADQPTESALLLDLGMAQISAGQREAGQSTLNLAATRAREFGAVEELANVALSLAPGLFAIEVGGYDPVLVALLREALAQVGHENEKLRALLLARLALALYWSDTFEERVGICEEAKQLAERLGGDDVKAAVTTAHAFALLRPANLDERRILSERAVELCGRVGDHHGLLINRLHRAALLLEDGDDAGAALEADAFQKLAEEVKQPQALWIVQAIRACRLLLDGRLAEVEMLAGGCLQTGQRVRDHNALQTFGVTLTLVRLEQGRGSEMLEALRTYVASYPRTVAWRALYAFALGRSGQADACAAQYESTKANAFAHPDDLMWMLSMAWLSEICHAQRDAEGARLLYERYSPYKGRFVVIGFTVACLGSVQRYLGLLSATMGRKAEAEAHFKEAIAANRRAHGTLPLGYTLYDYAALLEASGSEDEARDYLRQAEKLAHERNLVALQARIKAFPTWGLRP